MTSKSLTSTLLVVSPLSTQACLVEWLRVLPSTRQSFGTLFGVCPYCSTQIVVKTTRA
jgi:hypothetical protein